MSLFLVVTCFPSMCLQGALSAAPPDGAGVQEHQAGTDGARRDAGDLKHFNLNGFFYFNCILTLRSCSAQKLLCEDRFVGGASVEAEVLEKQLLSQMLEAVRVTPSLHEDLQVEVMKVRVGSNFLLHFLYKLPVSLRCFS